MSNHLAQDLLAKQEEHLTAEAELGGDYWCPHMVPGPLQTAEYARNIIEQADVMDKASTAEAVRIRSRRTQTLRQGPPPRRFLLTRAGLTLPVVQGAAMERQLAQVNELAVLEHVQVRVLDRDHPWQGPYTLRGEAVVIEGPAGRVTLPEEHTAEYAQHFARLWEVAHPFSRYDGGLYT